MFTDIVRVLADSRHIKSKLALAAQDCNYWQFITLTLNNIAISNNKRFVHLLEF